MIVNFVDANIAHADSWCDALEKGRKTKNIKYNKLFSNENGILSPISENFSSIEENEIILFTDKFFGCADDFSKDCYKIAWTMEPRAYDPRAYEMLESCIQNFDLILTWDKFLLEKFPEKCEFIPADGTFIDISDGTFIENYSIFKRSLSKPKLISHVYSNKTILEGHHLRHKIAKWILDNKKDVDLWGSGSLRPMQKKSLSLNDYMFSIAIENNRDKNYFTEKILDCFATKTIPIYWGAPNIGEWFNLQGIIVFEHLEEFYEIIENLSAEEYNKKHGAIIDNYNRCLEYYDYDEFIYKAIKKRV